MQNWNLEHVEKILEQSGRSLFECQVQLQYEMASTFCDFFKSENCPLSGLNQLVQTKAPLGDEWSKDEVANLADLLGRTIQENGDISFERA